MAVINVANITKDYGNGKGVFDISFEVNKGEVLGFLGPNGAGKTTTIRQLMGFVKPDSGVVTINNLNCFTEVEKIQENLGYLPGEIAFMEDMTGDEFIKFIAEMKKVKDFAYINQLKEFFELDCKGKIKKMSKGMKQKIGLICAFMEKPDILILDEPTSGLDPLMQNKFVELILKFKEEGKTILMSSHIFEEVEHTCDRVVIIKAGKIMAVENMDKIKESKKKIFEIIFKREEDAKNFETLVKIRERNKNKIIVDVSGDIDSFIKKLSSFSIEDLTIKPQSLEELFMNYYGGANND